MRKTGIGIIVATIVLGFSIFNGYAEVYIVTMEDEPVISYKGGVNGFEATAVESDEKIDVTRYSSFFASFDCGVTVNALTFSASEYLLILLLVPLINIEY